MIYFNGVLNMKIQDQLFTIKGNVRLILRDAKTGRIKWHGVNHNVFVTAGKNAIADHLRGTTEDSKGIITYCALGTGATAPAPADTKLQTELFRKLVSVRSVVGNVATFQTFFTTSEANGTLKEAALFGGVASETVDSGTLFCHTPINRTKSSSDTLTLYWDVTIG